MTENENEQIDYIEYQRGEIEQAKEQIESRKKHLTDSYNGVIIGEQLPTETKTYLRGYIDALDYSRAQVDAIDNLAKYAFEEGKRVGTTNGENE